MKLLIRADSSSDIGLGHIMRDLVLAEQYPGADILFACQELPGNMIDQIPYPVHRLASNHPQELIELIKAEHIERIIFDHYGIDDCFEKQVKEQTGITVLSLDDTYQKHYCDILINPNIYAQSDKYRSLVPSHTILRCGKEFLLIREEFQQAKEQPHHNGNAILIAMGGSDSANLTLSILPLLPEERTIHCVTTTSNPHLEPLQEYLMAHPNVILHINTTHMAQLMGESSLAIITPSTIAHEALFMGLAFIAVQSADNQSEFVAYMEREGLSVMRRFDPEQFSSLLKPLL